MEKVLNTEIVEMFQVEELDDRLEMCWMNCLSNNCNIGTNTTNTTCCSPDQEGGNPGITVPINGSCTPPQPNEP